ncbi:hypothetical protein NPIL_323081, partial [Nephila pilipes]
MRKDIPPIRRKRCNILPSVTQTAVTQTAVTQLPASGAC